MIVPDEYAGHVVQDIFRWIKNGMSLDAISDKLNVLGILSPMAYKLSNGENYKTAFQKERRAAVDSCCGKAYRNEYYLYRNTCTGKIYNTKP